MHALRHVHRLLIPGGAIVDLHHVTEGKVESNGQVLGTLEEPNWITEVLPNAERRLQDAIRDGLYMLEDEIEYDLLQHHDTAEDLVEAHRDIVEGVPELLERIRVAKPPLVTREHYVGRRLRAT